MEKVVLADRNDKVLGTMEKIEAHRLGLLHRAFSILIFNKRGELLIQKRAGGKYHCEGLWTNTVCSHPRSGESYEDGAHRRLKEEMGFDCDLEKKYCFIYKKKFDNGLTEHEYDCVFEGTHDEEINPDPKEIDAIRWVKIADLEKEIAQNPENYTEWFKQIVQKAPWDPDVPKQ
jgi:isopentenyl-diphosphate delta-isomerase